MKFEKYLKLVKSNNETVGFNEGICHIFPKLDGTNASLWRDGDDLCAGSRNRQLTINSDNAGFCAWSMEQENFKDFFQKYPNYRLYGEFNLNKGHIKTYPKEMERQLYVFDVWSDSDKRYLKYEEYVPLLEEFNIPYVKLISILENPKISDLCKLGNQDNSYVLSGIGEGIVLKNYDFRDKYGNYKWVKFLASSFSRRGKKNSKEVEFLSSIEDEFYKKCINKVTQSEGGYNFQEVCDLVFKDVIEEELVPYCVKTNLVSLNFNVLKREIKDIIRLMED